MATKNDRIKLVYKELKPIFNKASGIGILPLRFRDYEYIKSQDRLDSREFYDKSHTRQLRIKKDKVSPSLYLAVAIIKELGDHLYSDRIEKILNELIKSNPKKYFKK